MELNFSAEQATVEREQAREQANLERLHHSEQAHQERITKARRDAYLEVIGEMTKAQTIMSLLPAQDIEKLEVNSGLSGLIAAVSKVSILGEMATVDMSRELLTVIHQAMFRALAMLVPINEAKWEAEFHAAKLAEQLSKIDRLQEDIKGVQETSNDDNQLQSLFVNLDYRRLDLEKYGKASIETKNKLLLKQKAYADALFDETQLISAKVDELVISIRAELSLESSLDQLRASSKAMHEAAVTASKELRATFGDI